MKYTDAEKRQILEDFGNTERLQLFCFDHQYVGNPLPPVDTKCAKCWFAYYYFSWAQTPNHLKAQRLEEMEAMVNHAAEQEDSGTFDFTPYGRPDFTDLPDEKLIKIN